MARKKDLTQEAVFTSTGLAICPRCYSRPSVTARAEMSERHSGWDVAFESAKVGRETIQVMVSKYPCSNATCPVEIVVRMPSMPNDAGIDYLRARMLTGEVLRLFNTGYLDHKSVWVDAKGEPVPAPPPPPEPVKRRRKSPTQKKARKKKA